jgi:hypothetical protein
VEPGLWGHGVGFPALWYTIGGQKAADGGVTSPNGFANVGNYTYASNGASIAPPLSSWGTSGPNGTPWMPDMVMSETRFVLALLVRF